MGQRTCRSHFLLPTSTSLFRFPATPAPPALRHLVGGVGFEGQFLQAEERVALQGADFPAPVDDDGDGEAGRTVRLGGPHRFQHAAPVVSTSSTAMKVCPDCTVNASLIFMPPCRLFGEDGTDAGQPSSQVARHLVGQHHAAHRRADHEIGRVASVEHFLGQRRADLLHLGGVLQQRGDWRNIGEWRPRPAGNGPRERPRLRGTAQERPCGDYRGQWARP